MSHFDLLPMLHPDPIFGLTKLFNEDPRTFKVNASIGVYQDENGGLPVFQCIRDAETQIFEKKLSKNYQAIEGSPAFFKPVLELVFGENLQNIDPRRFVAAQTIGGTSALRVGGEFLKRNITDHLSYPNPSWPIHRLIFNHTGFSLSEYPYLSADKNKICFDLWLEHLKKLPKKSVVVLHGCCHNPSGIDPSKDEWQKLSKAMKELELVAFFDLAYQGFGEGVEEDAYPVRLFAKEGHEFFVAVSFSKNLGLYGERAGALLAICENEKNAQKLSSVLQPIIRTIYSNPPLTSARLVQTVLSDTLLKDMWQIELKSMCERIKKMRTLFFESLNISQNNDLHGMFAFSPLNFSQVKKLRDQFAIYLPDNARINLAALNEKNIGYVVNSMIEVMKHP